MLYQKQNIITNTTSISISPRNSRASTSISISTNRSTNRSTLIPATNRHRHGSCIKSLSWRHT